MNLKDINGYIFSKDYRFIDRWIIPLSIVILFVFGCAFLIPVFETVHDILPQIIAATFFFCVGAFLIWYKLCYSKFVWMYYSFEEDVISNRCGQTNHQVFATSAMFITELPIVFATKGATWKEKYYILSNNPLPQIKGTETGGIQLIKTLYEHELVIIPANDHMKQLLNQVVEIVYIPRYPKVAYWHRFRT